MALNLLKSFNLNTNEKSSFILLLVQSVFIGIYFGSISISAETLITEEFEQQFIQGAIFLSGFTGILLTLLYSFFQSRISFSLLSIANLIIITIITVLLRFGFQIFDQKTLIFLLFIFFGPLHIIAQVAFWGTATRLFSLRQGKRLFGIIDIGWLLGIILTTVTNLILYQFDFQTQNLLYFSVSSIFIAMLLQMLIAKQVRKKSNEVASIQDEEFENVGIERMLKGKYLRLIVFFVGLSVMMLLFIYSSFLEVSTAKYPEESNRGQFFSAVLLTMMVFSILLKSFAYDNLMKTYGLKIGLLITPVIIGVFTLLTAIIGSFGYLPEAKIFIFFFLFMALSRVLSFSLNFSIEKPAFKLIYQSLDKKIRYDVQAKVDGTVNETAFLLAGAIIFGLGMLSFFQVIHYSYVLFALVIIWAIIALRLHKEYKASLEKSLTSSTTTLHADIETIDIESDLVKKILSEETPFQLRKTGLELLQAINPLAYEKIVIKLFNSHSEKIKKLAFDEITSHRLINSIDKFEKINGEIQSETLKKEIKDYHQSVQQQLKFIKTAKKPDKYLKSNNFVDRLMLSRYIEHSNDQEIQAFLNVLLRDIHPDVRTAAITTSGKISSSVHVAGVIENLAASKYYNHAYYAIIKLGDKALDHLEQLFNKTDVTKQTQLHIIKLFGEIKGQKAKKYLLDKLNLQNLELLNEITISLQKCNCQVNEIQWQQVVPAINLVVSVMAWNNSALLSVDPDEMDNTIQSALEEEIKTNYNLLFNILSIAYDKNSVKIVRENLDSNTVEGIGFAIELLDIFIAEEQKQVLTMILEDTPLNEKVRRLQTEFPVDRMSPAELLTSLINRDYNYLNPWTKACAIQNYKNLRDAKITNDLLAQLFNPDQLLYETAAVIINKLDDSKLTEIEPRLKKQHLAHIKNIFALKSVNTQVLLIEKILFLKKIPYFASFPDDLLRKIGIGLDTLIFSESEVINNNTLADKYWLFVADGIIEFIIDKDKQQNNEPGANGNKNDEVLKDHYLEGDYVFLESISGKMEIKAIEPGLIHLLSKEYFNKLVFNNREMIPAIFEMNEQLA